MGFNSAFKGLKQNQKNTIPYSGHCKVPDVLMHVFAGAQLFAT